MRSRAQPTMRSTWKCSPLCPMILKTLLNPRYLQFPRCNQLKLTKLFPHSHHLKSRWNPCQKINPCRLLPLLHNNCFPCHGSSWRSPEKSSWSPSSLLAQQLQLQRLQLLYQALQQQAAISQQQAVQQQQRAEQLQQAHKLQQQPQIPVSAPQEQMKQEQPVQQQSPLTRLPSIQQMLATPPTMMQQPAVTSPQTPTSPEIIPSPTTSPQQLWTHAV